MSLALYAGNPAKKWSKAVAYDCGACANQSIVCKSEVANEHSLTSPICPHIVLYTSRLGNQESIGKTVLALRRQCTIVEVGHISSFDLRTSNRHLELLRVIMLRPYAILSRGQDTLRVKSLLDLLVQLHLCVVVEGVRLGDLIHYRQMGTILSPVRSLERTLRDASQLFNLPTTLRSVLDQRSDQPMSSSTVFGILAIEDDANNVVHLTHSDNEGTDEVKVGFFASLAG